MSGRRRFGVPLLIAAIVVTLGYLGLTAGVDRWRAHTDLGTGQPRLPARVAVPAETLPTTADLGPVGRVGTVFAVRRIRDGLIGGITHPWVAVSAGDGTYRALARDDLPYPTRGREVRVSPDGRLLAWASDDGLVLYDPTRDTARLVRGATEVGSFSPDGRRVLVYDGTLDAVSVRSGDRTEVAGDAPGGAVDHATWTPDGNAVTWVADGRLVTASVNGGGRWSAGTDLPPGADLAWSPSGQRLLTLDAGGERLRSWTREGDRLRPDPRSPRARGVYVDRLIGFGGPGLAHVIGYTSATATLPRLFTLNLDTGRTTAVSTLPTDAANWVSTDTVSFAADALAAPSAGWPSPPSPWSDRAVLTALLVVAGFVLGVWFTRRPRSRRPRSRKPRSRKPRSRRPRGQKPRRR